MKKFIPVNQPLLTKTDIDTVYKVLKSGWISSEGNNVKKFEKKFANFIGHKYGIAVSSGTAALEIAVKSLGLKKNDEVIVPAMTWKSTIVSVSNCGLRPILVDINIDNSNIDLENLKKKITKKTRAIIVVHLYGNPAER